MRFLCAHHRQQILGQPETALTYWLDWMSQGNALIENSNWQQACGFLGCSFELAEWLLQNPQLSPTIPDTHRDNLHHDNLRPIDRYMIAGHQLAECMGRSGHPDTELHYLLTVHMQLIDQVRLRLPEYWLLTQHLRISLAMLNRYHDNYGGFRGYYDCCLETELYIKQCLN